MSSIDKSKLVEIVNMDYDTLLAEAIAIKNSYPNLIDWDMSNPNDGLGVILESYLRAIVKDSNFANLIAQEFSLSTALTKDAVFEKAFLAGYSPTIRASAQCVMNLTIEAGATFTVEPGELILKGSNKSGSAVYFENSAQIVIPTEGAETSLLNIPFSEGRTYTRIHTGVNTSFETITIQESLIDGSVEVIANGIAWSEVFSINADTLSTDLVYELRHLGRNTYQIITGDGTNGALFPKNSSVLIRYKIGQGSEGNILTFYLDTIFSTTSARIIKALNVSQFSYASGGQDLEDIEKVRTLAPKLSKIQGTVSNRWDMDIYCNSYSGVGIAKSVEVGMDFFRVYIANETGTPTEPFMVQMETDIRDRLIIGSNVDVVSASKVSVNLTLNVIYDLSYRKADVEAGIQENLDSFLNPFEYSEDKQRKLSFGTDLLISDVYEEVTAVPGVIALSIVSPTAYSDIVLVNVLDDFILTNQGSNIVLNMISSSDSQELRADKAEKWFFNNPRFR